MERIISKKISQINFKAHRIIKRTSKSWQRRKKNCRFKKLCADQTYNNFLQN